MSQYEFPKHITAVGNFADAVKAKQQYALFLDVTPKQLEGYPDSPIWYETSVQIYEEVQEVTAPIMGAYVYALQEISNAHGHHEDPQALAATVLQHASAPNGPSEHVSPLEHDGFLLLGMMLGILNTNTLAHAANLAAQKEPIYTTANIEALRRGRNSPENIATPVNSQNPRRSQI